MASSRPPLGRTVKWRPVSIKGVGRENLSLINQQPTFCAAHLVFIPPSMSTVQLSSQCSHRTIRSIAACKVRYKE